MDDYHQSKVVIIGGGPSGLGAALTLAKKGYKEIVILEKRPSADYYEPDKSFSYQIDGRGQKLTDFLDLSDKLAELSVPSTEFYFTLIKKDGSRKTSKLPIADSSRKTAYWLPRASFVRLLYEEIAENWQDSIQVLFQTQCSKIELDGDRLKIIACQDETKFTFTPRLVIGCDGLNSIVRQTLHQWEKGTHRFAMQQYDSPSAGLKYKVLTLPAQFPLSELEEDRSESTMAYGIRSTFKERNHAISLGLLPLKNPQQPRTANIITYPDHQIWQLETSEALSDYFQEAFPQIPLEKIISPSEIARFLASKGGSFPLPQYCSGLYRIWGQPDDNNGTAVILFGDAVHCFPPDIGQGVNSALEDVYLFHETLAETEDKLSQALPRYQNLRQADIKALIRLVQISYPWQYNQNPLQKRLWSINFLLRLVLNRLFPFLFAPHSFILIQQHELSYSEILAKSDRTTRLLVILSVAITLALLQVWKII
ncbi:MAG: NAD(P)/FAD-dependent oxidoreductase [Cyanobacteria bacterium P01_G01_bin.39]